MIKTPLNETILRNGCTVEVYGVRAMWVLMYDGAPCNIRRQRANGNTVWTYVRTNFSNKEFARRKAEKFNKEFNTTLFTVAQQW